MIEQLLGNLKGDAMNDIMSKFGLDSSKAEGILKAAGSSTTEVVSENVKGGGLDTVMSLFSSKENGAKENGIMSSLQDNFIGKITSQFGLDADTAKNLSASLLPKLTGMITSKNEETDASDTSSIMSLIGGAGTDGIKDMVTNKLKNLF